VQRASGVPTPLWARDKRKTSAHRAASANVCFAVIARSEATKQSILSLRGAMDCFASLAMTGSTTSYLRLFEN